MFGFLLTTAFSLDASALEWKTVLDGVESITYDGVDAVRIDLELVGVSIFPQVSKSGEAKTATNWAKGYGLEVAINANFFDFPTAVSPCSIAVCNGTNWGNQNNTDYAQMGFTKDNRLKWFEQAETLTFPSWMYNVVSGTPEIVKNGNVLSVAKTPACVALGHCTQSAYRSGMAVDKAQRYLILAVTSLNSKTTVEKFASKLVALGADYAINLDGGGSSSLYVNGKTYGANTTRKVAVSLGFDVKAKPTYICKAQEIENPSNVFYDIASSHWGLAAAKALYDNKITMGCGSDPNRPLFCPDCGVKRVQAAMFIARALKLAPLKPAKPSFPDVTASSVGEEAWGAVEACLAAGIVSMDTAFRPNDVLTRVEGATILSRAYPDAIGGDLDSYGAAPTPTFTDVPKSHWGYKFVEAMARHCYISGKGGGIYDPTGLMTRIEFAAVLARISGLVPSNVCAFEKQCSTVGETSCTNGSLQTCIAYELVSENCPSQTQCKNGQCVSNVECYGSDKTCNNNSVRACENGYYVETPCDHYCQNGECVECLPSQKPYCEGNTVVSCINGSLKGESCRQNEICTNDKCTSIVECSEGATRCDATLVYLCKEGRWQQSRDCKNYDQICEDGACIDIKECVPGNTSCDGDNVQTKCSDAGKWIRTFCATGDICTQGQCHPKDTLPDDDPVTPGVNPDDSPTPGSNPENPTPGSNPENPTPGSNPENPIPGSNPENPTPGSNPENPTPGTNPSDPKPEKLPDFVGSDPIEEGCSQGNSPARPLPWMITLLLGCCALIRRKIFTK